MTTQVKFFTSAPSKYRSIFNIIGYRYLSSKQPTLYESIRTIESSTSKNVFIQNTDALPLYPNRKNIYGGQIIGTTTYAAQKTVTNDFLLHSLHAYFLKTVDDSGEVSYSVSRSRSGRSYYT